MTTLMTRFQNFIRHTTSNTAKQLYETTPPISLALPHTPVTIVCVSDTHNKTPTVPDGDILLHAGDLTRMGTFEELQDQLHWINTLPHQHKIVIAGNHDFLLDQKLVESFPKHISVKEGYSRANLDWGLIIYLENSSTTVTVRGRKVKIFGCPLTPKSGNWAFQYPPMQNIWKDLIPDDTDVLLTHGPPKGHLDVYEMSRGCEWLTRELWNKKPRLVVFSHIHAGHGIESLDWGFVQRLYDQLVVGDAGLLTVILVAFAQLPGKMWYILSRSPKRGTSTLINAAVVEGKNNVGNMPPRIIDI
jgi:calcineurin-like phosphoesterase family protein